MLLFRLRLQQEKATKWQDNVEIDGLTTNGVLIMHPKGEFCGGNADCGQWRETSVGGDVFSLRECRSAQQKGQQVYDENNILQDGTLIDLCGATLLWRSAEGLRHSPVSVVQSHVPLHNPNQHHILRRSIPDEKGSREAGR